jgi:transcription elongation factor GreA
VSLTSQEHEEDLPMSEARVPMTKQGFEALRAELSRLKRVERPKNVREIEEARAHGDISENAEFHAAKERQSHIAGQIAMTEDKLARAQVIDPAGQSPDRVRFGTTVLLEDTATSEKVRYRIVGEDEADLSRGEISVTSPVARALINREVADEVTVKVPKGTRVLEILEIAVE